MARKKVKPRIAVIDFETDPFLFDRKPEPFSAGFYDGETYIDFWGADCVDALIHYIHSRKEPLIIYAHNGGKFDFFYLLEKGVIENPALIIHGRIVKARLLGIHEIRDSYAILPLPLAKLGDRDKKKLEIDYKKLEKEIRENHKEEILEYQKIDCIVLYNVVFKFIERFGNKLTIGATAISELGKLHPVSKQNKSHDIKFRKFYFGGRVECFESGELIPKPKKKFKVFDVNSMYPAVMKNFCHPAGGFYVGLKESAFNKFDHKTGIIRGFTGMYFMHFIGHNKGALPKRNEETGGLDFNIPYGEFFVCSHELRAACELGLVKVDKILDVHIPCNTLSFTEFVDKFIGEKIQAKKNDDSAGETFAKLIANSAYGKYASNPETFKEWYIFDDNCGPEELQAFEDWKSQYPRVIDEETGKVITHGAELVQVIRNFEIWQAPAPNEQGYFDVAIAASITSAARSILLRAIHNATRPLYCDTDSLICEDLRNVIINDYDLGAWKFEGETDRIYIAGKKLYAAKVMVPNKKTGALEEKLKLASKGAKLTYQDIADLCAGKIVHWQSDAPNFKFTGETKFVSRNIRKNV